ncbi:hypothetical protein BJY14_000625 [Actinomadura luteofluorescens]|uniref:Allophanate hydrolase C-terminal domain-containing protein n=1 Tax=Actinomadura luteofluorescens TaxID=46163 RepID=A0A7Y9EBP7_9ACTN|nr:gamma-glutamylcyclotransferase [Actinomadura luteofluorescens]NYD44642.1 hypothetical protein [Actinomadura luteofluorescens]
MTALFVNCAAMRGGVLHGNIAPYPFLGEARTAPRYRFYSVRDEFAGLHPADDGVTISGELYDVPLEVIGERFMPAEPPEFELGVIALADAGAALGVVLRSTRGETGRYRDISGWGGWRSYERSLGRR